MSPPENLATFACLGLSVVRPDEPTLSRIPPVWFGPVPHQGDKKSESRFNLLYSASQTLVKFAVSFT